MPRDSPDYNREAESPRKRRRRDDSPDRHRDDHYNARRPRSPASSSTYRKNTDHKRIKDDYPESEDERRRSRRRSLDRPRSPARGSGPAGDTGHEDTKRRRDRERSSSPYRRRQRSRERSRERSRDGDKRREMRDMSVERRKARRELSRESHKVQDRNRERSRDTDRRRDRSRDTDRRRDRSRDRSRDRRKSRRSPSALASPPRRRKRSPSPFQRSKKPLPSQEASYKSLDPSTSTSALTAPPPSKQKPNYAPSGLLAKETNTVTIAGTSVILKYNEPPDARKSPSSAPWRLYVFKGPSVLDTIELHTRSCWLFGRETLVADVPVLHPSCSSQHAVVQFRYTEKRVGEFGDVRRGGVKPYLIDLESANGTVLNGERVEGRRFVELRDGDVVKFGLSEREYVVMLPPKEGV